MNLLIVAAFVCLSLSRTTGFTAPVVVTQSASRSLARTVALQSTSVGTDPKEIVKLFGRLAEKYILLDSSGGNCCYSGCTGKVKADGWNVAIVGEYEFVQWLCSCPNNTQIHRES